MKNHGGVTSKWGAREGHTILVTLRLRVRCMPCGAATKGDWERARVVARARAHRLGQLCVLLVRLGRARLHSHLVACERKGGVCDGCEAKTMAGNTWGYVSAENVARGRRRHVCVLVWRAVAVGLQA